MYGKRLVAATPLWLPHYETQYGALESLIRSRLLSASATRPGTLLNSQPPSAPTTGISLSLVSSRPTPLCTAAIRLPVIVSGA